MIFFTVWYCNFYLMLQSFFEKKVDIVRKFECNSSQVPPSSSLLASQPLPTEEPVLNKQVCNHGNRVHQITKNNISPDCSLTDQYN